MMNTKSKAERSWGAKSQPSHAGNELIGEVLPALQTIPDCRSERLYLPVSPSWMAESEPLPVRPVDDRG
jgi:hypothetical protein